MLLYLGLPYQFVERAVLLIVTNHDGIILIDALPVQKEHIARMQTIHMITLIKHNRTQRSSFTKEIAHGAITLLMQLVRSNPNPCYTRISALPIHREVTSQFIQQGTHHHRFSCSCRSLEYQLLAVFRIIEHVNHLLFQFTYRLFLVIS